MDEQRMNVCAICGERRLPSDVWFLIAENRWEDKLKVLQWNDRLAAQRGILRACSVAHVEELVVHWMTTGSLDYPFARIGFGAKVAPRYNSPGYRVCSLDTSAAQQIGELAVHRESMERILVESPQSLRTILDALLGALRRDRTRTRTGAEVEDEALCRVAQEV
jgi:hypothetical protein